MYSILLVDDHEMIRNAIKQYLDGNQQYQIVSEAENGKEAFDKLLTLSFDLVITDVHMPVAGGLELLENIRLNFPDQKVLALTMDTEPRMIRKLNALGIHGYVLKNVRQTEFIAALDNIFSNNRYFSSEVQQQLTDFQDQDIDKAKSMEISNVELAVLQMIVKQTPHEQIMASLSLGSVEFSRIQADLFKKANCTSEQGLILFAIEKGLI